MKSQKSRIMKMGFKTCFLRCFVFLAIALVFVSCGMVKVVGYNNDYDELTEEQKGLVYDLDRFDRTEVGKVYKINPELLKAELRNHPKSLVYVFSRGCNSEACKSLSYYVQYAAKNGYTLFLVMKSYIAMPEALEQHLDCPLFVIDDDYFNEHRRFIYERYFTNEMMGLPRKTKYKNIPENMQGNLLFFERDQLIKVSESLDD